MQGNEPDGGALQGDEAALAKVDAAHDALLDDSSIQFGLPQAEMPPPPTLDLSSLTAWMGPLLQVIFWLLIGLAAAGLVYLIATRLAGWQPRGKADRPAEPDWQLAEAPARQLLGDADALAAEGRYSEAAHLLLHRSIAEIDRRRPATVRKALTSRDIARLPSIPPAPAASFSSIVRAVERSLFGGRTLDLAEWRQCREAYESFAFARNWQA